jgi:SNF family Na+-dependent transporter
MQKEKKKIDWAKIAIFAVIVCATLGIYYIVIFSWSEKLAEGLIKGNMARDHK